MSDARASCLLNDKFTIPLLKEDFMKIEKLAKTSNGGGTTAVIWPK
jgi:hypothetical protein